MIKCILFTFAIEILYFNFDNILNILDWFILNIDNIQQPYCYSSFFGGAGEFTLLTLRHTSQHLNEGAVSSSFRLLYGKQEKK